MDDLHFSDTDAAWIQKGRTESLALKQAAEVYAKVVAASQPEFAHYYDELVVATADLYGDVLAINFLARSYLVAAFWKERKGILARQCTEVHGHVVMVTVTQHRTCAHCLNLFAQPS